MKMYVYKYWYLAAADLGSDVHYYPLQSMVYVIFDLAWSFYYSGEGDWLCDTKDISTRLLQAEAEHCYVNDLHQHFIHNKTASDPELDVARIGVS